MSPTRLRPLTPADTDAYIALRREMLLDSPWAFGASPGQDRGSDPDNVRRSLANTAEYAILGAFDDTPAPALLAAAGLLRDSALKRRHVATIWGVYTTPPARGRGLGRAVVSAAVAHASAWPGIARVHLSVSEQSPAAQALYHSLGFTVWGREPDCLRIGDRSFDELHMSRPCRP